LADNMVTGVSRSLVREFGTVYLPHCSNIEFGYFKRLLKAFLFGKTAAHL